MLLHKKCSTNLSYAFPSHSQHHFIMHAKSGKTKQDPVNHYIFHVNLVATVRCTMCNHGNKEENSFWIQEWIVNQQRLSTDLLILYLSFHPLQVLVLWFDSSSSATLLCWGTYVTGTWPINWLLKDFRTISDGKWCDFLHSFRLFISPDEGGLNHIMEVLKLCRKLKKIRTTLYVYERSIL